MGFFLFFPIFFVSPNYRQDINMWTQVTSFSKNTYSDPSWVSLSNLDLDPGYSILNGLRPGNR